MQTLHIEPTLTSPEIDFRPAENVFIIKGNSAPEDVRALYYPVIEWIRIFIDDVLFGEFNMYNESNPIRFRVDLSYFNSSSAKFLYDILIEFKRLSPSGIPVLVEWAYEENDPDMKDAGMDISSLAGIEFLYISKN
jgi:hypothetical protein